MTSTHDRHIKVSKPRDLNLNLNLYLTGQKNSLPIGHFYELQGKVMFSEMSVIPLTGGSLVLRVWSRGEYVPLVLTSSGGHCSSRYGY